MTFSIGELDKVLMLGSRLHAGQTSTRRRFPPFTLSRASAETNVGSADCCKGGWSYLFSLPNYVWRLCCCGDFCVLNGWTALPIRAFCGIVTVSIRVKAGQSGPLLKLFCAVV